jgi:UDP-3-O-[3-hydroxymyristoyl] glucosamine N-acyltransferase
MGGQEEQKRVTADRYLAEYTQMLEQDPVGAKYAFAHKYRDLLDEPVVGRDLVIHPSVRIGAGCSIGLHGFGYAKAPDGSWLRFPHVGRVVIEEGVEIGSNVCIDRGSLTDTRICSGVKIDNHVHIAHNVIIGRNTLVIAHAMIGGSVTIGESCWIAPGALIKNKVTIGDGATVGLGAVVLHDVDPGVTVVGNPAMPLK